MRVRGALPAPALRMEEGPQAKECGGLQKPERAREERFSPGASRKEFSPPDTRL